MEMDAWFRRIETRLHNLEVQVREHEQVVGDKGYIQQAFERQEQDFDEIRTELREINGKLAQVDAKLDIILSRLTGTIKAEGDE